MKLISPLPDCTFYSVHQSLKYDREPSCADKSSAGSNHTSSKKHHTVCHLNPNIATSQTAATMKKKRRDVVNSVSILSVLPAKSKSKSKLHKQQVSPTLPA